MATSYRMGCLGFGSQHMQEVVCTPKLYRPAKGLLFNCYWVSFPEIKKLEHEADHSNPSSAQVQNEWSYTSTPPVCIHGVERSSTSILLLVLMVDIRLCTVYQFSVKFSHIFLGTVMVSNQKNLSFTFFSQSYHAP